ncbi:tripartite tricarboxylate transporter substrate binding protein [Roseibium sp.]|uniref:tripartite tricarboxylate transporter substrate binding protein n=1 Tax=Roseibium sp. TaxID=1936156 RepID=UPI003D1462FA
MKKFLGVLGSIVISAAATTVALADYPERPIKMIVAYSAGGGTDIAARTLAPFIEKYLGGTIVVENKAGAGGEIGFSELAKARADGYTIGFINSPNVLTIPIERSTSYSLADLSPIANVIYDPGAFSVRADSDIETLDDLIAFAKKNPGAVTYGTTGIGSDDHLAALAFQRQAGIEMTHIPFKGNVDVRAAVLGGHIMLASMNVSQTIADHREGSMRLFGQMSNQRWDGASEIPTFKEQGYDIIMGSDRGMSAPAGIDPAILSKLSEAVAKAVADPKFLEKAGQQNLPITYMTAADFTSHLTKLNDNYADLWKEAPWSDSK